MDRLEGIPDRQCQRQKTEEDGIYGLHQEQGGGTPDIADHAPSFPHGLGQDAEIPVQQGQLRHMPRRACFRTDRDGTVSRFQGGNIVDAVPGHAHGMAHLLERLHQQAFLLRGHAAEHRIFGNSLRNSFISRQFMHIDAVPGVRHTRLGGNARYRLGIVAADDFDCDALFGKILECFARVIANLVPQAYETQHTAHFGAFCTDDRASAFTKREHSESLPGLFLDQRFVSG